MSFKDDIILLASSFEDLQKILRKLNKESKLVGFKMNLCKTKNMMNYFISTQKVLIGMDEMETVYSYTYLIKQVIKTNGSIMLEINIQLNLPGENLEEHSTIFKSGHPISLKRKFFISVFCFH